VTVGIGLLANPKPVAAFNGSAYYVEDILYQAPAYSFSYRPENAPRYSISSDYLLYGKDNAAEEWTMIGKLYEYKVKSQELLDLFQTPSDRVYDAVNDVKMVYRADAGDDVKTFYLVMQRHDGKLLLAMGYDNENYRHVRWLFGLGKLDESAENSHESLDGGDILNDSDVKDESDVEKAGDGNSADKTANSGIDQKDSRQDFFSSYADNDKIDIVNLPEELYIYRNFGSTGWISYMNPLRFDFDVKEETELVIKYEINNGSLSLKLKPYGSDEVIYGIDELQKDECSVTLQPGKYSLILKGYLSDGYLHVTSR
jgi:hypothetical protein